MNYFFVNLKRFDVPIELGGICPLTDADVWITEVLTRCAELNLGQLDRSQLTFFLPEGLIVSARKALSSLALSKKSTLSIGIQGVYRENVEVGGNFGAFTSLLPAAAAQNLGAHTVLVGHSEERKDKLDILSRFSPDIATDAEVNRKAQHVVHGLLNEAAHRAWQCGMKVVFCVGETKEEQGHGDFHEQKHNIKRVLQEQLLAGLRGAEAYQGQLVIAYEPIWAIGPGKTPPDSDYIAFVAVWIKEIMQRHYSFEPPVVYGGGMKKENATAISSIKSLDGGLIALTHFEGQPGFTPEGLRDIIKQTIWEGTS